MMIGLVWTASEAPIRVKPRRVRWEVVTAAQRSFEE
jgi:hypothetical protein